jgi:hypothetical protein
VVMTFGLSESVRARRRPAPSHIVAMVIGLALMVGVEYLLMPLVLRDRAALTQVPDTAGPSIGAAAALTERLRDEGLTCSDGIGAGLLRVCADPHDRGGASVRFTATSDGTLLRLFAEIDASPRAGRIDAVIDAAATAFELTGTARTRFFADAAERATPGATADASAWGSYRIERHKTYLLLHMFADLGRPPDVTEALPGTIDQVRLVAEGRGYACRVAQAGNLACAREVDGFNDRLFVEPYLEGQPSRIGFEVVATRRAGVLAEWNTEFAAILDGLGGSVAPVADWLHANPRAGGADVFIGPVELAYRVDLDAYVKEVFGWARTARL